MPVPGYSIPFPTRLVQLRFRGLGYQFPASAPDLALLNRSQLAPRRLISGSRVLVPM